MGEGGDAVTHMTHFSHVRHSAPNVEGKEQVGRDGPHRRSASHASLRHCPAAELEALARTVRGLSPDHRDPERFHAEKSVVAAALRRLAAEWRAT